nr:Ribosomal RNA methyltransferase (FmrO) [uncultured bacterium]
MATSTELTEITGRIIKSKKYSHLSQQTIHRIVEWAAVRFNKLKEIEDNSRKKLHQVYGAYMQVYTPKVFSEFTGAGDLNNDDLKTVCKNILLRHNSTKERMGFIDDFYAAIHSAIPSAQKIIDIGCGFNPFSYPWLATHLGQIEYAGFDIDVLLTEMMNNAWKQVGLPVSVQYNDVFFGLPGHTENDVLFFLKFFPCLEQQEKGISAKIFNAVKSNAFVVSFPSVSLTGKNKGMRENYDGFLNQLTAGMNLHSEYFDFPTERVYILKRAK